MESQKTKGAFLETRGMQYDLAILGSGFGGSITALVAKQMGMKPVLIEKKTHPRFAIGESSTPQANIALSNIATKYNLPRLQPLARYGTWKEIYPELGCGAKRGFTYIQHPNVENELLVSASPNGLDCDTHWYRADLDSFLVQEAKNASIPFFDNTAVSLNENNGWELNAKNFSGKADFLIDATGGANPLHIPQDFSSIKTNSRVIYSHFEDVIKWGDIHGKSKHPYPCHNSALHHIFKGGWMYVLHFDNGITSAGFVLDCDERPNDTWESLMDEFPHIKNQFKDAKRTMPLVETKRLQRCATKIVGENWAMLPNAAYCIDPFYSTGNAHTLCCVDRLMQCIGDVRQLRAYEIQMREEISLIDQLVHGSYSCLHEFETFVHFAMLYFAGADFSERRIKENTQTGFLNSNDQSYKSTVSHWYNRVIAGKSVENLGNAIEPWNMVGLCDPTKQNMYEYA
jgi:FADH2 O2-dependent halogenase